MQVRVKENEESLEFGALDGGIFATMCKKVEVLFGDEIVALESEPFTTLLVSYGF